MRGTKPIRVLIVDDDDVDIRESLAEWLRRTHKFAVDTANDGAEAIAFVRKATGDYDAILMDLQLGKGPDGIDTMKAIQAWYPDIGVIIITGYGGVDDGVRAMKEGARNYVFKPLRNWDEIVVYFLSAAERQQLKAKLGRKEKQLKALQDVGQELNKALDPIKVQDVILEKALELTEAHFGAILQCNKDNSALIFSRVCPPVERLSLATRITQIPLSGGISGRRGITGRVALEKRTICVADVTQNPDYIAYILDMRSELAVPLMYGDECIGVLDVEHKEVNAFSEEDQEFLEALAHQAAIALCDHININRALDIIFNPGFNFFCFASLFQPAANAEVLIQEAKELETLFRKLLREQIEVVVCGYPQEHEGAFFVHAKMRYEGSEQVQVVIGCGKRATFKQRKSIYLTYVPKFARVQDALEFSFAETPHYAAAAYSLGSPIGKPTKSWLDTINGTCA